MLKLKPQDRVFIRAKALNNINNAFKEGYNQTGYARFIRTNVWLSNFAVLEVYFKGIPLVESVRKSMCLSYFNDTSKSLPERISLFLEVYHV